MARVNIWPVKDNPWQFEVEISESSLLSRHRVTLDEDFYKKLNTTVSPIEVVRLSIEFLLEREGPESILREFNLRQIPDYFEGYLETLQERLRDNQNNYNH